MRKHTQREREEKRREEKNILNCCHLRLHIMAGAPSCSSSSSSNSRKHKAFTESEMEAAQQLMQLSDEENSNNIICSSSKTRKIMRRIILEDDEGEEQEVDQKPICDGIVMAKIQEIFGNDVDDFPQKKQRRYRSLANIYNVTRPIDAAAAAVAGNERRVKA